MLRKAHPLVSPPRAKPTRERTVHATNLRLFIGNPRWSRWKRLLEGCGVPISGRFTYAQCRVVMEAWYRELGEFQLKRRRA